MVYLAGPTVITCSFPSFHAHPHPSPPLFAPWWKWELFHSPASGWLWSGRGANLCHPLNPALSLPSLISCPCQEGREDVLGLDPSTEPAQAGPSSQEAGGATGQAPLSPLNPSAPGHGCGLGACDPSTRCPPPFRGTRDHPGSMKGEECRSSERLSQEGTAQHGQRSSRIAEKGDVWFVLTTQTDALQHVCIYGIHMLSWEIRGQQHKTRIHNANAKKTYMATRLHLHMFLWRCLFLEYRQSY